MIHVAYPRDEANLLPPQLACAPGGFSQSLPATTEVELDDASHSIIPINPVERNASRMTFIIQLHSQCVSSVQKVDLGGQNGYEKDQGYMEWPYVLKNT